MARRRGASRKLPEQRNPTLKRGLIAATVLLLAVSAMKVTVDWLADPASFPVRTVGVAGELHYVQGDELRAAIEPLVAGGLVRISLPRLQASIQQLAWVRTAAVRRAWPDRLEIAIEEQVALARWADGGLLNPYGERFVVDIEGDLTNLPLLEGPQRSEQKLMQHLQEMQRMLESVGLRIARLEMSERRAWSMTLDNGLEVDLGRRDTYPRLLRFVRVYPGVVEKRLKEIQRIDLRYTNGFAVRWQEGSEAASA